MSISRLNLIFLSFHGFGSRFSCWSKEMCTEQWPGPNLHNFQIKVGSLYETFFSSLKQQWVARLSCYSLLFIALYETQIPEISTMASVNSQNCIVFLTQQGKKILLMKFTEEKLLQKKKEFDDICSMSPEGMLLY